MKKGSFFQILVVALFVGLLPACAEEASSEADVNSSESNIVEPAENTNNANNDNAVDMQSSSLQEDIDNAVEESVQLIENSDEAQMQDEGSMEHICIDSKGKEVDCTNK